MNKRERVTAAFRGQEVDHVPVSMWQHVPPEYWGNDDKFAEVQARFLEDTDVDGPRRFWIQLRRRTI